MEVGIRFLKVINTGIMLLFLGGLLWIYASIESDVVADAGLTDGEAPFTKEFFFYTSLMVFAITNAFMYIAAGILSGSLSKKTGILYFKTHNDKMKLLTWLRVFQIALSLCVFFLMVYFGLHSMADRFFLWNGLAVGCVPTTDFRRPPIFCKHIDVNIISKKLTYLVNC